MSCLDIPPGSGCGWIQSDIRRQEPRELSGLRGGRTGGGETEATGKEAGEERGEEEKAREEGGA